MDSVPNNDRFGRFAGNAVRFWETGRIPYNLALTFVVFSVVGVNRLLGAELVDLLTLASLAIIANLFYCTSYVPDFLLQFSDLSRMSIYVYRAGIWVAGTIFAMIVAFCSFIDGSLPWSDLIR